MPDTTGVGCLRECSTLNTSNYILAAKSSSTCPHVFLSVCLLVCLSVGLSTTSFKKLYNCYNCYCVCMQAPPAKYKAPPPKAALYVRMSVCLSVSQQCVLKVVNTNVVVCICTHPQQYFCNFFDYLFIRIPEFKKLPIEEGQCLLGPFPKFCHFLILKDSLSEWLSFGL